MQRDAGFQRVMLASVLAFGLAPAWVMAESSTTAAELSQDSLWAVWGGEVGMRWNRELLADMGLSITKTNGKLKDLSWRQHERFNVRQSGSLEFRVHNNNLQGFVGGSVQARGGYVLALNDGTQINLSDFRLRTRADDPLILDLVGADGIAWFYVDRLMYELVNDNRTLAVQTMDLRISPALASRLGFPERANWAIADMMLLSQVLRQGVGATPKGGGVYDWSGTQVPGQPAGTVYQADLFMQNFSVSYSRCNGCTGSSTTGQVVFTPSSTLRNNVNNGSAQATVAGDPLGTSSVLWTADIPWYTKFSGTFAPYSNDQHPYLIWNLYRYNADGSIDQIGRSGVKHAFLTTNVGCASGHGTNSHVLGRACSDTYGTGNNDSNNDLGPRSEIIPADNIWGRCGSIYDTNCDGNSNSSGNGQYSQRLITIESQIDPALNAGASYRFESWYLAREDVNIYNSMATRGVSPSRSGSTWMPGAGEAFRLGSAIDRWAETTPPGGAKAIQELSSSEGHVKAAVKVFDLGGGQYRYDYVIMNFDFARAATECLDPNPAPPCEPGYVKVVHNFGLDRFRINTAPGISISNLVFSDGDLNAANDWTGTVAPTAVNWVAPADPSPPVGTPAVTNPLNWGTMFRFSFTANAAPTASGVHLHVAQAGSAGQADNLTTTLLGPGAGNDVIFVDGFETLARP